MTHPDFHARFHRRAGLLAAGALMCLVIVLVSTAQERTQFGGFSGSTETETANPVVETVSPDLSETPTPAEPLAADPLATEPPATEPLVLRLRIAWGGGSSEQWQGQIEVTNGTLSSVQSLAMQADEPGSKYITASRIQFRQPSQRIYDGVDVTITGTSESRVRILLAPMTQDLAAAKPWDIKLADLVSEYRNEQLDERGNRLLVRRAPGDVLQVKIDRPHLIFQPGEHWDLAVIPHFAKVAADTNYDLALRVHPARKEQIVSEQKTEIRSDSDGLLPAVRPFSLTLPEKEGVYDLVVSVEKRSRGLSFSLQKEPPLLERTIQVVCLLETPLPKDTTEFTEKLRLNPAEPGWWKKMLEISQLKRLPGWGDSVIGNDRAKIFNRKGVKYTELAPKGWQAIPLPVEKTDVPHILEVEYPLDEQLLGISIVDADTGQPLTLPGVDSGVAVSRGMSRPDEYGRHRIVFWPRGKVPLVLLSNLSPRLSAKFVQVRLLAGPNLLPENKVVWQDDSRLLAAYLDKPLFTENFGGSEAIDGRTGRSLKDWVTFYEGAIRLAQYLKHSGYNAAVINVAGEGSAIYPSEILQPTPKFDTGTFFTTGQDPVRKDVLELLSRVFDREGLKLIPVLQFSSPLPELEQYQYNTGKRLSPGVRITGDARPPQQLPRYNVLDPVVQTAMLRVVDELVSRYSDHSSFHGVAIGLERNSYTHLPNVDVGYESATVAAFADELRITIPGFDPAKATTEYLASDATAEWLKTEANRIWLPWRVSKVTKFHHDLAGRVRGYKPSAKVLLLGGGLLQESELADAMRERLPIKRDNATQRVLLEMGLDPAALVADADVRFLCPQLLQPALPLSAQASSFAASQPSFRNLFAASRGTQILRRPQALELERFSELSPFQSAGTRTWIAPQLALAGGEARRPWAEALANDQADIIVDGGWMLPLGGEPERQSLVELLAALPQQPAEPLVLKGRRAAMGNLVELKAIASGGRKELIAANLASYPVSLQAAFVDRASTRQSDSVKWEVTLEPYEVATTPLPAGEIELESHNESLSDATKADLAARISELKDLAENLRAPHSDTEIANASFEETTEGKPTNWILADRPDTTSKLVPEEPHSGKQSLMLDSGGPVLWVRSSPIPVPDTGRLSVAVWLRTDKPSEQPTLRLAIEGRHHDEVYYRFARVGAGEGAPRIRSAWAPFIFQIDQLPASDLRDLRIGFDLMGKGRVWIDDVQLFDVWFLDHERDELLKNVGVAAYHLDQERWAEGIDYLDGYWAEYLRRHVPMPPKRVATRPADPVPPPADRPKPSGWRLWPF